LQPSCYALSACPVQPQDPLQMGPASSKPHELPGAETAVRVSRLHLIFYISDCSWLAGKPKDFTQPGVVWLQ